MILKKVGWFTPIGFFCVWKVARIGLAEYGLFVALISQADSASYVRATC